VRKSRHISLAFRAYPRSAAGPSGSPKWLAAAAKSDWRRGRDRRERAARGFARRPRRRRSADFGSLRRLPEAARRRTGHPPVRRGATAPARPYPHDARLKFHRQNTLTWVIANIWQTPSFKSSAMNLEVRLNTNLDDNDIDSEHMLIFRSLKDLPQPDFLVALILVSRYAPQIHQKGVLLPKNCLVFSI